MTPYAIIVVGAALVLFARRLAVLTADAPINQSTLWAFGGREGVIFFSRAVTTIVGVGWIYIGLTELL